MLECLDLDDVVVVCLDVGGQLRQEAIRRFVEGTDSQSDAWFVMLRPGLVRRGDIPTHGLDDYAQPSKSLRLVLDVPNVSKCVVGGFGCRLKRLASFGHRPCGVLLALGEVDDRLLSIRELVDELLVCRASRIGQRWHLRGPRSGGNQAGTRGLRDALGRSSDGRRGRTMLLLGAGGRLECERVLLVGITGSLLGFGDQPFVASRLCFGGGCFGVVLGQESCGGLPVTIVFGTESGGAELVAEDLRRRLDGRADIQVVDLSETDPHEIDPSRLHIVVCSTYGDGELPTSVRPFREALLEERPDLSDLPFAVFGMGDRSYSKTYSRGSELLAEALTQLGATRVGEYGRHDAGGPLDAVEAAGEWLEGVLAEIAARVSVTQ